MQRYRKIGTITEYTSENRLNKSTIYKSQFKTTIGAKMPIGTLTYRRRFGTVRIDAGKTTRYDVIDKTIDAS